jgi:hypothetical protein
MHQGNGFKDMERFDLPVIPSVRKKVLPLLHESDILHSVLHLLRPMDLVLQRWFSHTC